jgi:hypothetical protein
LATTPTIYEVPNLVQQGAVQLRIPDAVHGTIDQVMVGLAYYAMSFLLKTAQFPLTIRIKGASPAYRFVRILRFKADCRTVVCPVYQSAPYPAGHDFLLAARLSEQKGLDSFPVTAPRHEIHHLMHDVINGASVMVTSTRPLDKELQLDVADRTNEVVRAVENL